MAGVSIRSLWDPSFFLLSRTAVTSIFPLLKMPLMSLPATWRALNRNLKIQQKALERNFSHLVVSSPKVTEPFACSLTVLAQGAGAGQGAALLSRPPRSVRIAVMYLSCT